ncbi:MAG: hypothetical protein NZL83_03480 [Candidatus Absconditabacterales bacterium]|nr:hypothetical protein [Candidatus Absconditabacterales bacterium]
MSLVPKNYRSGLSPKLQKLSLCSKSLIISTGTSFGIYTKKTSQNPELKAIKPDKVQPASIAEKSHQVKEKHSDPHLSAKQELKKVTVMTMMDKTAMKKENGNMEKKLFG